jgi:lipoprotein-anchoring transpeptidase ErfK/SrfK
MRYLRLVRVPGGRRTLALVGVAAAVGVPSGFVAAQYVGAAELEGVSPGPGTLVNTAEPRIRLAVRNPDRLGELRLAIDGRPARAVVVRVPSGFVVSGLKLAEGRHVLDLGAHASGLFGGAVRRRWTVTVDTSHPALVLDPVAAAFARSATLAGSAESGATLIATWRGGRATVEVPASGRFSLSPDVPDGTTPVELQVRDPAGNATRVQRVLRVDRTAPAITAPAWPAWASRARPRLAAQVADGTRLRYAASVDGVPVATRRVPGGVRVAAGRLAEGTHRITVTATDLAGNATSVERQLNVDSTEVLASTLTLRTGARGADVRSLTRRLKLEGVWRGRPIAHYTWRVERAVRAYQRAHGLKADGVARPDLLERTWGRIVVVKHLFRVFAYRDGKLLASYPIAIGQPAYPSPTGTFHVVEMIRNPTWIPPNSPWAQGLEPIPPGSTNPLGPRWIGTSAPAVGLHGTPQDWTIGTAASHGCIRMHIPDVIKLFEQVRVGETVEFKV